MDDEPTLPTRMPPPPHTKLAGPRPATTRIPRVFNIWGTLVYAGCSAVAFLFMIAMGFDIMPPWYVILPTFLYVFLSSGIIALDRIEANKNNKFFIDSIKRQSETIQKHVMRKMN